MSSAAREVPWFSADGCPLLRILGVRGLRPSCLNSRGGICVLVNVRDTSLSDSRLDRLTCELRSVTTNCYPSNFIHTLVGIASGRARLVFEKSRSLLLGRRMQQLSKPQRVPRQGDPADA